jgi:hypothetical protein
VGYVLPNSLNNPLSYEIIAVGYENIPAAYENIAPSYSTLPAFFYELEVV